MAFGVTRDPLSGAVQANAAASGRKLYGLNRSTSANRGQTLDPAGYQERELRRKARKREESRRFAQMAGAPAPLGSRALGGGTMYGGR